MRPRFLALSIMPLLLAAGCLGASVEPASTAAPTGATLAPGAVHVWTGASLAAADGGGMARNEAIARCLAVGDCPPARAPCAAGACERTRVVVPGEPGARYEGRLVVGLRWPTASDVWLALTVEDASGAQVAEGRSITIDHAGAVAVLDRPAPGAYDVVVAAASGRSDYEAAARLVPASPAAARSGAARDLLPDLVTLPPTDLTLADPPGQFVANAVVLPTQPLARAAGARGCAFEEALDGARRCLRFSNSVGNLGEGPLDVALSLAEGATFAAGGRFTQRILQSDGAVREVDAGPAEYHAVHAHWHNAGAGVFTVHPFDRATGERGAPLAEGRKTGMCYADVGVIDVAWPSLGLPEHQGAPCFNPAIAREWRMGLSRGWYDNYVWILGDQYVDIEGVPDGTYALCSEANGLGFLVESDTTNNVACTAFRLEGDSIETLDPPPYHAMRDAPPR